MTEEIVIRGRAYQRPATIEVAGDTLIWRARRSDVAENVATTTRDVRDVTWLEKKYSAGAGILAVLSFIWMSTESVAFGLTTLAIALGVAVWRWKRPRYWLGLDLGERWLVLRVAAPSANTARALSARIQRRLMDGGEPPPRAPTLP